MVGLFSQSFPPRSKFNESDIPDQSGRVAVVTGANTGIGFECARALLTSNAKVYLACRSEEKGQEAIKRLEAITGKQAHFILLDLGNVQKSYAAAKELAAKEDAIHLLFNSAGVMMPPKGSMTEEGLELQWGTNGVGHYCFTQGLLPTLKKTAAVSKPGEVRIITTSSSAHTLAPKGGVNLLDQFGGGSATPMQTYGQSKLLNVIMAQYWATQLQAEGIISVSLNPGNIGTELGRHFPNWVQWLGKKTILHAPALGAITQLYAGTSKDVTMEHTGGYFIPWARVDKQATAEANDPVFCAKVMDLVKEQASARA